MLVLVLVFVGRENRLGGFRVELWSNLTETQKIVERKMSEQKKQLVDRRDTPNHIQNKRWCFLLHQIQSVLTSSLGPCLTETEGTQHTNYRAIEMSFG